SSRTRRRCQLQVYRSSKAAAEFAVDLAGHRRGEVTACVRPARDNDYCETWISKRSVRGEKAEPSTLSDAGTSLAGNCLEWIICFFPGTVVHGSNHSRNHSTPS